MSNVMHRQMKTLLAMSALATFLLTPVVCGQRGIGDPYGIAQCPARPPVVRLSGELEDITNHPCENSTGPAVLGTHLILRNDKGKQLNIHLGPTSLVGTVVKSLSVGNQLDVIAFHTERLPANQYVATTVIVDDRVIRLRDHYLRPYWAGRSASTSASPRCGWTPRSDNQYGFEYRSRGYGGCGRGWRLFGSSPGYRGRRFGRCWGGDRWGRRYRWR